MTVQQKPPSILNRIGNVFRPSRATWVTEDGGLDSHDGRYDMLNDPGFAESPASRRRRFTDTDYVALHEAVYACIRLRTRMITRPTVKLVRKAPDGEIADELPNTHPAMQAYLSVNEGLTTRQGAGLIEQHKGTSGKSYWVKRRDSLGTPVEFEVWDPRAVEVKPDPRKPWVPLLFRLHRHDGSTVDVELKDMVWFRHLIDPRNPLNGLAPITAARVLVETGYEAARFNQAFFDNSTNIGHMYKVPEGGPAEVQRIRDDLARAHRGTDNSWRDWVSEGDLEEVSGPVTHKDMQFIEQQQWTKENVAMVYELSPVSIGDLRHGSFENTAQGDAKDWTAIQDQLDSTLAEWTEFMLWPDFGIDLAFIADYSDVPALQGDLKLKAEIDEIRLGTGQRVINEVRKRDGLEPVEWGDVPILPLNVAPLGSIPVVQTPGQLQTKIVEDGGGQIVEEGDRSRGLDDTEDEMEANWVRRLDGERKAITRHLTGGRGMRLSVENVDSYNWNWWERYGDDVQVELADGYVAGLAEAGFTSETTTAQRLASAYARDRAGELLKLSGDESLAKVTRDHVKRLVAETIDAGQTNTFLRRQLAESPLFSRRRAETIARTEIATAQGQSTLASYDSLGHEGKKWSWPGGEPDGICDVNDGERRLLEDTFSDGSGAPPAHPNCRCSLIPVRQMPRSVRKEIERDEDGRMVAVTEEDV